MFFSCSPSTGSLLVNILPSFILVPITVVFSVGWRFVTAYILRSMTGIMVSCIYHHVVTFRSWGGWGGGALKGRRPAGGGMHFPAFFKTLVPDSVQESNALCHFLSNMTHLLRLHFVTPKRQNTIIINDIIIMVIDASVWSSSMTYAAERESRWLP